MGRIDVGLKCIQLRSLIEKREYEEAYKVAEKINLDKVTSIVDLKVIASIYERLGKYEEAKDILLRSYEKKPTKMVIYRLAYLCVKTNEFEDAEFFYQEFSEMAPNSPDRYILRYGIDRAKGVDYLLRIATLQKLKQIDYMEEWGYELAKVYHKAGLYEECIQECNDLITWFGDGIIVEKAQMLRQFHEEGKESLDPYGVFDEGLSKEELEARREQFIADTQDLRSQAMLLAKQQKKQEVYRQLDRDLEKTVDLRQVLAEEGEDMDLLKQAVHRSWGQSSSNGYETINVKKVYAEQESSQYSYDRNQYETQGNMHEFVPAQTPEEVIAASLAEVLTEEELRRDDWEGYAPEEQFEQEGWNGYASEEQFEQEGWNGYAPEEQHEQEGWNGYAPEEQHEQEGWNGYATEEYAQEFAQEGYMSQETEEAVYSKDDFSSMMEQIEPEYSEEEYLSEEMSGEVPEGYVLEGEQGAGSGEYLTEQQLQEALEDSVIGEFSQEEIPQESFEKTAEETEALQEVVEESITEEAAKEPSQEENEDTVADEAAKEISSEEIEEKVANEAVKEVLQEEVEESVTEETKKEASEKVTEETISKENSSENETNASEIENASNQTDKEVATDIELFEDETEIPAYVQRAESEKKSSRKEKKKKKRVSKKKQQIKQKEAAKPKQQPELKAEEKTAKPKQQTELKTEEKVAKPKQQTESKAEEKAAKPKQQTESKAEEKATKQKQQIEQKAVKQKQQIRQKEEKKKRKGFFFNFGWGKKKEKEDTPKMDVELIGKELDLLIEEVNQREEAEREEFNTLPPEALQEREPVKKKVFTDDISDVDPESMIGIGDSVGEPYIAKPKQEDVKEEQEAMPEAAMEAGEYAELSEAVSEYVADNAEEASEYVGESYTAEVGEYVGEPYVASNTAEAGEYAGEPYIAERADAVQAKETQEEAVDFWNYFLAYQYDTRLCEDIQMTIEGIKSGKRSMNMLITCKEQKRASQMGRDMAKAMKALGFTKTHQIACVDAEKLNRMHLEKNYDQLKGRFLLVEGAKKITADTAQSIMNMINEMGNEVVVILTDARPYMNDLMNEYKVMHRYFPNDLKMK